MIPCPIFHSCNIYECMCHVICMVCTQTMSDLGVHTECLVLCMSAHDMHACSYLPRPHMGACDGSSTGCLKELALILLSYVECHCVQWGLSTQYVPRNHSRKPAQIEVYSKLKMCSCTVDAPNDGSLLYPMDNRSSTFVQLIFLSRTQSWGVCSDNVYC